MQVNVEPVFRDVDAEGDLIRRSCYSVAHLFLSHACHPGRQTPWYPFGPHGKEGGDQTLNRSCSTSAISIRPPSPPAGCNPPVVNRSASNGGGVIRQARSFEVDFDLERESPSQTI